METVRIERDGPVWTVVLARPDIRNAVDGPTAAALASAFRAFDAAEDAAVAVLWGEGVRERFDAPELNLARYIKTGEVTNEDDGE